MLQYIVQPGDTLSKIAGKVLGNPLLWEDFGQWNDDLPEPQNLQVGYVLKYPASMAVGPLAPSVLWQESPQTSVVSMPAKPLTSGVKLPPAKPQASQGPDGIMALLQDKRVQIGAGVVLVGIIGYSVMGRGK